MNNDKISIFEEDFSEHLNKKIAFMVEDEYSKSLPTTINSNYEEVKKFIISQTNKDRNTIVTEETIDIAKERCAILNKQIKAIEEQRKEVKKTWNEPYIAFENKCKELIKIITAAKDNLWIQVTEAENKEKNEKREKYKNLYNSVMREDILHYFPFEAIEDTSWLNKGKSYKVVSEEINSLCSRIMSEVVFLEENCKNPAEIVFCMNSYKKSRMVTATLSELKLYREEVSLKEKKKKEEIEQKSEQEEYTVDFRIIATSDQIQKLKEFLAQNHIKYGRVPK